MTLPSVGRFPYGWFLLFVLIVHSNHSAAQSALAFAGSAPSVSAPCCTAQPTYLGSYLADGKFRASSPGSNHVGNALPQGGYHPSGSAMRPVEVPGFINLHPLERVVEDYQPPARAEKAAPKHSFWSSLRDNIVTVAYGRERVLSAPRHLTVDSRGRMIVSDPGIGAVHVLDGNNSFRIPAGPTRRLHVPAGVAVDADDNIYVADPDRGVVVVFDRNGMFLRDIGKVGDESLFHAPTSIALDRQSGRLYLLDTPRSILFMLDLQGNVLKRVGRGRGHAIGRYAGSSTPLDLREPTEIALGHERLAVLDSTGSRVRIMNLECDVLAEFNIRVLTGRETAGQIGLGIDSAGNLYASNLGDSTIRVYDASGHLRGELGHLGSGVGEFSGPSGLWLDSLDRIYIADTNNQRIQIFQAAPYALSSLARTPGQ